MFWGASVNEGNGELGGAERIRTADLLHAMQALSQLSYRPTESISIIPDGNPSSGY